MRIHRSSLAILAVLPCICFFVGGEAQAKGSSGPEPFHGRQAASRDIDRLIDAKLRKKHIEPMPVTSDEQFVRRIYLDVVGRIPTLEEARAFLSSKESNMRPDLINTLLQSPGH